MNAREWIFTDFDDITLHNRNEIQQLIVEILRFRSAIDISDIAINETAKLFCEKINDEMDIQASDTRGIFIFIDVEKIIKMQMEIIALLNSFKNNKLETWPSIKEKLLIQIKRKIPGHGITLFFRHSCCNITTTLSDVDSNAEVTTIYNLLFERPEVKRYSKLYTYIEYRGNRLNARKKISDYGISDLTTLHLLEAIRAGDTGNGFEEPIQLIVVSVKKISGKIIKLNVDKQCDDINTILEITYKSREDSQKEAAFESYSKYFYLSFLGRRLDLKKTLSECGINESCLLQEVGEDFTRSPSFDWNTLQVIDYVSLGPCSEPYMLDPGCTHAFDKSNLKQWIDTKVAKKQDPDCPCCRQGIDKIHVAALSMWSKSAEGKQQLLESQHPRLGMNSNNQ